MKYLTTLAILFLLSIACSDKQENNSAINYEPGPHTTAIDISKCITDTAPFLEKLKISKVLQLKDADKLYVSNTRRIIEKNDSIFILDYKKRELSIFGPEGNYLGMVGAKGKGPGEHSMIVDFEILHNGDIVVSAQEGLMLFDKNRQYLSTKKGVLPLHISKLVGNGLATFAGYKRDPSYTGNLVVYDTNFDTVASYFPYPREGLGNMGIFEEGGVKNTPYGVLYNDVSSPVFHEVTSEGKIFAKYMLTGSDKIWPFEKRHELEDFQAYRLQFKEMYYPFFTFQENETAFIFTLVYKNKIRPFFYDKKEKQLYLPDLLKKYHMFPLFLSYDGLALSEKQEFIIPVYMDRFYKMYNQHKEMKEDLVKYFPELLVLTEGTDHESNPALVYFTFGE